MIGTDTTLQKLVDELKSGCDSAARGLRGSGQTRWMLVGSSDAPVSPLDAEQTHSRFDRAELERTFTQIREGKSAGTRQDVALSKAQSDFISAMERDFTARHKTRVRRLAHEALFRQHHGSDRGYLTTGLLYYLQLQLRRVSGGE